ncbi:hypothetical protein Tco_0118784, partial [Tanacetum coccineum]
LKPKLLSLTRGGLGKIMQTYLTQSDFSEMKSGAWKEVLFARVSENLRLLEGFGSSMTGSFHPSSSYWDKSLMVSHVTYGLNFLSLPPAAWSMDI